MLPFATALSVDLLHLNIIKLRFLPSAKSVSKETVEGLGQSIQLIVADGNSFCYHQVEWCQEWLPFATALSVDLLHLNIIKLRFLPSAKSISKETVDGLGQSIQLNCSRW